MRYYAQGYRASQRTQCKTRFGLDFSGKREKVRSLRCAPQQATLSSEQAKKTLPRGESASPKGDLGKFEETAASPSIAG